MWHAVGFASACSPKVDSMPPAAWSDELVLMNDSPDVRNDDLGAMNDDIGARNDGLGVRNCVRHARN